MTGHSKRPTATEHPNRHIVVNSLAFVILGALLLLAITGVATGIVAGIEANKRVGEIGHDLTDARGQRDELQVQLAQLIKVDGSLQVQVRRLSRQNSSLAKQNRALTVEVSALVDFLHSKGLKVPNSVLMSPSATKDKAASTGPKAQSASTPPSSHHPRRPVPGTPAPTPAPTPPSASCTTVLVITIFCP